MYQYISYSYKQIVKALGFVPASTTDVDSKVSSVSGTAPISSTGGTTPVISLNDTAVTPGNYGSASQVPNYTVDSKGRLTAAANTAIQISESQVTNLTTDLAAKVATSSLGNLTDAGTDGITITGGTGAVVGSVSVAQHVADSTHSGYLSSTDWSTFNNKQAAISLTTTGASGASTFTSNTLNVPTYTLAGLGGVSSTLTNTHILVGNGSNVATDVAVSGEVSITNAGVTTVANSAVIGKVLTGYTSGAGTVSATDTLLQAIQKINGNVSGLTTGVSSVFGRTGAVTATSGDYSTNLVTENTNLYFTNARAIAATLTAYTSGAGTISSSDSTLTAIQKLNGNDALKELLANKATDFTTINNTLYPTVQAVNNAINTAITGVLNYRGAYDASTNLFPATGGSGTAGAILKGNMWICSVAGTLGGTAVSLGDLIIANVDTPLQIAANWDLVEHDFGYAPVQTVTGTSSRITSTGGINPVIDISAAYVGQNSITTLGTISTGTWQSTKIGLAYGGTNADLSATGGTSQYLKQSSSGAAVTVGTIPASDIASGAALTRTNDTNVTLTLGGSSTTSLLAATSLTLGWTGTLAETRGGTAQSTYALGDTIYSSATNTLAKLAGNITTTKKFFTQTGNGSISAAPGWNTIVAGDIPDLSATYVPYVGATADVNIAAHNFKLTGYISQATTAEATNLDLRDSSARGTTYGFSSFGLVAGSSSSSIDVEQTNSSTAAGATVDHTVFMDDQAHYSGFGMASKNYNVSGSSSINGYDSYLYSFADNVGILAYGAGKKVFITAGGGNTANVISDFSAYGLRSYVANQTGYTTIATAAGTTTLTSASTQQQYFTGTLAQTVKLPDTSTIAVGFTYRIRNLSTGLLTVQTSTAAALTAIPQYEVICTCISVAGNTAAAWDLSYMGSQTGSFSVNSTTPSTPAASLAVGSISNLSAAPVAATGSGNALTVTSSTSKVEAVALAGGVVTMWCENSNMNGASTSPNFAYQFYYNAVANLTETGFTTLSATYNPVGASGFGSIASGQAIELKWRQASGTGQRTTVFAPLTIHWIWRPS